MEHSDKDFSRFPYIKHLSVTDVRLSKKIQISRLTHKMPIRAEFNGLSLRHRTKNLTDRYSKRAKGSGHYGVCHFFICKPQGSTMSSSNSRDFLISKPICSHATRVKVWSLVPISSMQHVCGGVHREPLQPSKK